MDTALDRVRAPDGHRSSTHEVPHPLATDLEIADGAIRDIFTVALVISSARSLSLEPAAVRLDVALDELDGIVRALRRLALAFQPTDRLASIEERPNGTAPDTTDATLVAQAASALAGVDTTLTRLWADAVAADGHGSAARQAIADATHLVRQARLTLTAGVMG